MIDLYYLDSNIFILPALYEGKKSDIAKKLIHDVIEGKIEAATCSLTFDEITYIISNRSSRKAALKQAERIMEFPHLKIIDVKGNEIVSMLKYMDTYDKIQPRDAIHLSAAVNSGIYTIVSDDDDFKEVKEVEWKSLEDMK